jgi:hypothetical protein
MLDYMSDEQLDRHRKEYARLRQIGDRRFGSKCNHRDSDTFGSPLSLEVGGKTN